MLGVPPRNTRTTRRAGKNLNSARGTMDIGRPSAAYFRHMARLPPLYKRSTRPKACDCALTSQSRVETMHDRECLAEARQANLKREIR
jgi:hypothetical protein